MPADPAKGDVFMALRKHWLGMVSSAMIIILTAVWIPFRLYGYTGTGAAADQTEIYFVDSEMMRLLPSTFYLNTRSPQAAAEAVLAELIAGRDENKKIRRIIPKDPTCLSVYIKDRIAYVNLGTALVEAVGDNRLFEELAVYQIVNSLTALPGIDNVRFTIRGESRRDLAGFMDLRETFIPDYYV